MRVLLLPALLLAAAALLVWLRLRLVGRRSTSALHADAAARVPRFVRQYPLHPYPILAKAFELAFLDELLPAALAGTRTVVEVAIGEGSLSERVFPASAAVVGLDISPQSLVHAAAKPHVRQAVVCDCLDPPVGRGSFDLLVANNFLHHVSAKAETLARWAPLAERATFNESSRYWASAWPRPYLLGRLGFRERSRRATEEIEVSHLQSLWSLDELDRAVSAVYEPIRRVSYFSERTFFYCGVVSGLMRCSGPPTPAPHKRLFTGALRWVVEPLTRMLATALIRFDELQDRSRDVYVSYFVRSRSWSDGRARAGGYLVCPDCRVELTEGARCPGCATSYRVLDGMLFLLPHELAHIAEAYRPGGSARSEAEHL